MSAALDLEPLRVRMLSQQIELRVPGGEVRAALEDVLGPFLERGPAGPPVAERWEYRSSGAEAWIVRSGVETIRLERRDMAALDFAHEVLAAACLAEERHALLHAGVVALGDRALLLPGTRGRGKTTLVARLLKSGFRFVTDEIAALDLDDARVLPCPRPLNPKEGTLEIFGAFEPEMRLVAFGSVEGRPRGHYARPRDDLVHAGRPEVAAVVFPCHEPGAADALEPLGQGSAALRLVEATTNLARVGRRAVSLLAALARRAPAFSLRYSDHRAAASLLVRALAGP